MQILINKKEEEMLDDACKKLSSGKFCGEKCDICFINYMLANAEHIRFNDLSYDLEERVCTIMRGD